MHIRIVEHNSLLDFKTTHTALLSFLSLMAYGVVIQTVLVLLISSTTLPHSL